MIKKPIRVIAGAVLACSVVGVVGSVAGASSTPGAVAIHASTSAPPYNSVVNTAIPGGTAGPLYGVKYCTTSTVVTITTKKCIELVSASDLYIYATKTSGTAFSGHQNYTGGGYTGNSPKSTYGTNAYTVSGSFSNVDTYCNTLWKNNSTGGFRNMGSVCT